MIPLLPFRHSLYYKYPGLELLPDGRILTMTYGHWDEGESPYILACHLDITEVDAMYRRMTGRAL